MLRAFQDVSTAILVAMLAAAPAIAASGTCVTVQGPVGAAFLDCAAGQAHNILPPGSDGLVNAADFARQESGQGTPPHQQDQVAPYADLEKVAGEFPAPFDATHTEGQRIQADAQAYIDGINAYIQAALANPDLMPVEYSALQQTPTPWKGTDVVATATLVQATFAIGGGDEVDSALLDGSL